MTETGRLFFREKEICSLYPASYGIMEDRKKCMIGVAGIGSGAGATFVSMSLALCLGEKEGGVVFAEGKCPAGDESGAYRLLCVDKAFREMNFTDYFYDAVRQSEACSQTKNQKLKIVSDVPGNFYKNVSWIVHHPEMQYDGRCSRQFDFSNISGRYVIVDNPLQPEEQGGFDILIAVVEPLPSRISSGLDMYRMIKQIEEDGRKTDIIFVINKNVNKGTRRSAENFLKIKFDFEMDNLTPAELYRAQYNCTQPYFLSEMPELKKMAAYISERFSSYFSI